MRYNWLIFFTIYMTCVTCPFASAQAIEKQNPEAVRPASSKGLAGSSDVSKSIDDESVNDESSLETLAFEVIDEIVSVMKLHGDGECAAAWQAYRLQYPVRDEMSDSLMLVQSAVEVADLLSEKSEFRKSRRLLTLAMSIVQRAESDVAAAKSYIDWRLGLLDLDCEDYQSAISRFDSAAEAISVATDPPANAKFRVYLAKATALRKLKELDGAEHICKRLEREIEQVPESLTSNRRSLLFEMASLHIEQGKLKKAAELLSTIRQEAEVDGGQMSPDDAEWFTYVNAKGLLAAGKIDVASKWAESDVDQTQLSSGVQSRSYVDSIELLAKVRIAQSRLTDAVELLKKSADIRIQLFGADHPSLARTHKEIDRLRKQQFGGEELWNAAVDTDSDTAVLTKNAAEKPQKLDEKPIWTPVDFNEIVKGGDRYGNTQTPPASEQQK